MGVSPAGRAGMRRGGQWSDRLPPDPYGINSKILCVG